MPKKVSVVWNGKIYESITSAARDLKVPVQTLYYRIRRGWSCDDDITHDHPDAIEIEWNGIKYPSIKAAAKALNVDYSTMYVRYSNGYTGDDDFLRSRNTARCSVCKERFKKNSPHQRYCSDVCKKKAQNQRYYRRNRKRIIKKVIERRQATE